MPEGLRPDSLRTAGRQIPVHSCRFLSIGLKQFCFSLSNNTGFLENSQQYPNLGPHKSCNTRGNFKKIPNHKRDNPASQTAVTCSMDNKVMLQDIVRWEKKKHLWSDRVLVQWRNKRFFLGKVFEKMVQSAGSNPRCSSGCSQSGDSAVADSRDLIHDSEWVIAQFNWTKEKTEHVWQNL